PLRRFARSRTAKSREVHQATSEAARPGTCAQDECQAHLPGILPDLSLRAGRDAWTRSAEALQFTGRVHEVNQERSSWIISPAALRASATAPMGKLMAPTRGCPPPP